VKVENAFGMLKEIFGSLKELRVRVNKISGHKYACDWILACCVLYNIIRPNIAEFDIDDNYDGEAIEEENENRNNIQGEQKRLELLDWMKAYIISLH